jgi:hypothetical protein
LLVRMARFTGARLVPGERPERNDKITDDK